MKPRLLITLVSYKDLPLLRQILAPVEELMGLLPVRVLILDNADDAELAAFLQKEHPQMELLRDPGGNIGYGPGHNALLKHAGDLPPLVMVLTSDVFIDPVQVKAMVEAMEADESLVQAGAKVHFWDLAQGVRSSTIDSLGIMAQKRHHFYDLGQGEVDRGQYDGALGKVFGVSGAIFMIRSSVFPALHGGTDQLFDERMWMYKEDIDLAYRLRWLGAKIQIFPQVWAWHARTLANREGGASVVGLQASDANKADYGRLHSYKNHILLLKNNVAWGLGFGVWRRILFYEFLKGAYLLFRHPAVFFAGLKTLMFVKGSPSAKVGPLKDLLDHFE